MSTGLAQPGYRLDVYPAGDDLAGDALRGLRARPKALPPKYFYDERGSELFERITRLPEYYQTRTELALLRRLGPELVERHGVDELVELGSGASRKTEALLAPLHDLADAPRYVPFDVCPEVVLASSSRLLGDYPRLAVHGVAGDFLRDLPRIPAKGGAVRLVAFLGGTIGNLEVAERAPFLRSVAELLDEDDLLLIGTDLAGPAGRIEPAYNDAEGVTAQFNLNLLRVLNARLRGDFDLAGFAHVARYLPEAERIEMHLRSRRDQVVRLEALDLEVPFAAGEEMLTEISCKFTRASAAAMYESAGLRLAEWHEDPRGWYALSLARPAG